MPRVPPPAALLARAVRLRIAGDLPGEESALRRCLEHPRAGLCGERDAEVFRTARFCSALLQCQLGRFAEADEHLSRLGLGARLSDAIWAEDCSAPLPADFFVRALDGGLPPELVEKLGRALGPGSPYWAEHRYEAEETGFFSHAHDIGQDAAHVVDELVGVLGTLLGQVAPEIARDVQVAEWWTHHRRRHQWHGHPMHYDTDENVVVESHGAAVPTPAVSAVVYLCEDSPRFGPTLVTSQRPRDAAGRAEVATLVRPRPGRVLFFDGGYLHGALPGRPWLAGPADDCGRLCIMVGFWTRPVAPVPPADPPRPMMRVDPASAWVRSLGRVADEGPAPRARSASPVEVLAASPIWADVPTATAFRGSPFFGRYFLTHRGQVDEDICNL